MLLDNGFPPCDKEINHKGMGLRWCQVLVMQQCKYHEIDDSIHSDQLHTITLSVLAPYLEMVSYDSCPDSTKILQSPTTAIIHENIVNVRVLVIDQANSKPEDDMSNIAPADTTAAETTLSIKQ